MIKNIFYYISQIMKTFLIALFLIGSSLAEARTALSSDQALQALIKGNKRYVEGRLLHPNRTQEWRDKTADIQSPFAIILGCSDSRVAPEILFDQGIGDLFVVRVAGNVAGPIEIDSIEYSALYLGSSLLMVLGHQNCGAVTAVLEGKTKDIEAVATLIAPSIEKSKTQIGPRLENAIKDNILHVVHQLKQNVPIRKLINKKKLKVIGGYYNLVTGEVEILE